MPPKKKTVNETAVENRPDGDAPRAKLARAAKQAAVETVNVKEVAKKSRRKATEKTGEKKDEEPQKDVKPKKATKAKPAATTEEENGNSNGTKPKKTRATRTKATPEPEVLPATKTTQAKRAPKSKVNKKDAEEKEEEQDEDNESKKEEPPTKKSKQPLQNKTTTDYEGLDFSCDKKNGNDKIANLKISSWNVDGMRAWIKKNGLEYITKEDPDILCLQETKCSESKLPEEIKKIEAYKKYWCSGEKDGYAGVALLSKTEPISIKYGLGLEDFDNEGRCLTAEYDGFYLVSVYVPNAGRGLVTLPKRLSWNDAFKQYINDLDQQKPVIVCGDMNVAHTEIDLTNPTTNKKNAGFTPEEREGMTEFLKEGYVDSYRELYPDKKDVYTFWSYMNNARSKNVGWRLDYFIVSQRFMDNICDNVVRSEVFGSDHCPITLFLNV